MELKVIYIKVKKRGLRVDDTVGLSEASCGEHLLRDEHERGQDDTHEHGQGSESHVGMHVYYFYCPGTNA